MTSTSQNVLIQRYLLGDLPEEQQFALEKEYLADSEMLDRVWEIENSLVDRYARGELKPDEKTLFERNYLVSPVHRERVAFATALIGTVDSQPERRRPLKDAEPVSVWRSAFLAALSGRSLRWAAVAAVLLFGILSAALLIERSRLHRQIDALKAETAAQQERTEKLATEVKAAREQNDNLASELARLHDSSQAAEGAQAPANSRSILSMFLSPLSLRSAGEAQELKLSKATKAVLLQMRVEQDSARVYQVDLRTVGGVRVLSRSSLKARPARNGFTVSVTIPSARLNVDDYILTLSATSEANQTEEINRYSFRVSKE